MNGNPTYIDKIVKKINNLMKYYVYELIDPRTDLPFYIGLGVGNRAQKHERYLKPNDTSYKANVIRQILKEGKHPEIKKVFFSESRAEACDYEIFLISKYGKRIDGNGGILTNITDGGDGGDTVTGADPEKVKQRYLKRKKTIENLPIENINKIRNNKSAKMIENWKHNKEMRRQQIKKGIKKNRDKDKHAEAVSNGWKNRSQEEKLKTKEKRSKILKDLFTNPETRSKMLNGSKLVSIPVKITDSTGKIYYAESLLKWCNENNESYGVLWSILNGTGPKPNKYKKSKYLDWRVEKYESS